MIQVQIASQVTATGLDGIRWVLLEDTEGASGSQATAAPEPVQTGTPPVRLAADGGVRRTLTLVALKSAVALTAFGASLWTAFQVLGPPGVAAAVDERPATDIRRVVPADGSMPSVPMPKEPAASAAAVITAGLQ
jgi:hypothetical protein